MRNGRPNGGNAPMNALIAIVVLGAIVVAIIAVLRMDPRGERNPSTGRDYARQVREAGFLDPAHLAWTEATPPWTVDMDAPVAMARGANGDVYVIGDRLVVLDAEGEQRTRTKQLEADYRALTLDDEGRIYAVTPRRIDFLSLEGNELTTLRSADVPDVLTNLGAVAVNADGVYVGDAMGCRIFKLPHGLIGEDGVTPAFEVLVEKLMVPSGLDVAVSPEGELVTVDPGRHLVQVRDSYGDVVRSFGKLGSAIEDFHGCCNPAAIAMTPDGRTVTAEKGLGATRVKVYDREGQLETIVAGPSQFDELGDEEPLILDVAFDAGGHILVLDPHRKQVRVFLPQEAAREGDDR